MFKFEQFTSAIYSAGHSGINICMHRLINMDDKDINILKKLMLMILVAVGVDKYAQFR